MSRVSWRRIVILLVVPLGLLVAAVLLAPLPPRTAGSTRCLPILGPRVLIDSTLSGQDRVLAIAHEEAHAMQCREEGAFRNYFGRVTRTGRLHAELVAYCAEGKAERRFGHPADHVVARILDELQESYAWFRGIPRSELQARLAATCPDLAQPVSQQSRDRARALNGSTGMDGSTPGDGSNSLDRRVRGGSQRDFVRIYASSYQSRQALEGNCRSGAHRAAVHPEIPIYIRCQQS